MRFVLVSTAILVALGLVACDRHPHAKGGRYVTFQGSVDTFLLDSTTGRVWKLEEGPGDEPGAWITYAEPPRVAPAGAQPAAE